MKKPILLSILLVCVFTFAKAQVLQMPATPRAATMPQFGSFPTTNHRRPSVPTVNTPFGSANRQHPNDYEMDVLRRQRQQELFNAFTTDEEMMFRVHQAEELIHQGFPSRKGETGTECFAAAYDEIRKMLQDSIPLSLERAVFLVENAYLGNQMKYDDFRKAVSERVRYCNAYMKEQNLDVEDNLTKAMSIYQLLTDTITIQEPGTERQITHYPLLYNLEDYDSHINYTSHFITTLLNSNIGNCHSMPLLYLILAERMGAKAHLSYAPRHSFVKIQDNRKAWYNIEITSRAILSDYHYVNSSNIKAGMIRSKIYMAPLSAKEAVGGLLGQMAVYYMVRYGYDPFGLQCTELAKQYAPNDIRLKIIDADYQTRLTLAIAQLLEARNPQDLQSISPDAYKHHVRMLELYKEIDKTGYEETPVELYEKWLEHVASLKAEERLNPQPKMRKITK